MFTLIFCMREVGDLKFTKMQGCGNDYVYVNGFEERVSDSEKPELVRRLSDRHFGIGGDGVIFINPAAEADFEMEMYNADGSRSEMCGNGIRCVGKFVYDKGLTDKRRISVVSAGKIKYLDLTVEGTDGSAGRGAGQYGKPHSGTGADSGGGCRGQGGG
jgi:diaminopimelate epimerase